MSSFRLSGLVVFLCGILLVLPSDVAARQDERPEVRKGAPVFETDTFGPFRLDKNSGQVRASYRQVERKTYASSSEFLQAERQRFGWDTPEDELLLVRDEQRPRSRHLTYQQTFKGLPVSGRSVRVNMDHAGRVSMVTSAFERVQAEEDLFDTQPRVGASFAAHNALEELASGNGQTSEPTLVILDPEDPHLAWELIVWPEDEPSEWRVWVDARSGEILSWYDQVLAHRDSDYQEKSSAHPIRSDGSGYVYDPGPLFSTGQSYGAPYIDNNDATNAALDAARKTVTLRDISQNGDGKWVLEGPYVRIVGRNSGGTTVYNPPAMDGPDDFFFNRADDEFEAVNAYYHIDKNQRYVQSLGILDVQNTGVDVNPQGLTRDNSFYYPSQNLILFGTGGIDDAEDPSVVIHEYGHALLNGAAPNLLGTQEGLALHEGFSDYWQGSYYRNLVDTGQALRDDWRWIFLWDAGEGAEWSGRYLENNGTYPNDVCTATSNSCGGSIIYDDGMLWAATLMEVWDVLGHELTDELVLLSHYYLSAPVTFMDAAQAVIQADTDYFGGAHLGLLIDVFSARGLIDASAYGPLIDHEPLLSTETTGGEVTVQADVSGVSSDLSTVELVYRGRTFEEVTVTMQPEAGNPARFTAPLMLPTQVDTVFYYVRAVDQIGNETFEPETAPAEPHFFVVGVDVEAPLLSHSPPTEVTFEAWPIQIAGEAQDNFGIAAVRLIWSILDPDGFEVASGNELLSSANGAFSLAFPAALSAIENGSRIRYAIEAQDASSSANLARYPESGMVERLVQVGTVLRNIDLTDSTAGISVEGTWSIAEPTYGTLTSPDGGVILGTNPGGSYSASAGLSSAQLAPLNLARVDAAWLQFWHFYDTEHLGGVDPSGFGGGIRDGGMVQYRSSTTADWTMLAPIDGYPSVVEQGRGNPLAGQPAFGGFSFGWRQETIELPLEDGLEIRFAFATDDGNDGQADRFAGWLLDSIALVTELTAESGSPEFASTPAQTRISSTQAAPPQIEVTATDVSGLQDVWVDWSMAARSGLTSGTARMTQAQGDLDTYVSVSEFVTGPLPGDVLTYTVRAADPHGNESSTGPFEVRFRLFSAHEALTSIWSTGNWNEEGGEWHFSTSTPTSGSALVLEPRFTETNAQEQILVLDHEASFDGSSAGLVEISVDGGESWMDLVPEGGYPGIARLNGTAAIDGRRAFIGSIIRTQSRFDLSDYSGDEIQVRIQAASEGEGGLTDVWRLFSVEFRSQTENDAFSVPTEFALYDAFPNPTGGLVRLSWSVQEAGPVRLELFDGLGRQVATVIDSQQDAGVGSLTWDTSRLSSGVYFLRLQSGGRTTTKTLVVN